MKRNSLKDMLALLLVMFVLFAGMPCIAEADLVDDLLESSWKEKPIEEIGEMALPGTQEEAEETPTEPTACLRGTENEYLQLYADELVLGLKETNAIYTNIEDCWFESDNNNIATVTCDGMVTGRRVGTTVVTVTSPEGQEAYCRVEVKKAPNWIKLSSTRLTLHEGDIACLEAILPNNTASYISYESDTSDIVEVWTDGYIYASDRGTAKITARTFNGKKATCTVTVDHTVDESVCYRALLIGEAEFENTSTAPLSSRKDVARLDKMLRSVKGPYGNKWDVHTRINRTTEQIVGDIRYSFSGATDEDVSLFYIASHGNPYSDIEESYEYAGSLATYDGTLTLPRLAELLNDVPGRVIVLIDSCGAGAAVYEANGKRISAAKAFDNMVVDAFSGLDNGVYVRNGGRDGAFVQVNKFYVMTGSAYKEYGWDGIFSECIAAAVNTRGRMPGDSNRDGFLTLKEWHAYAQNKVKNRVFRWEGKNYKAHFQVYPSDSGFEVFCR